MVRKKLDPIVKQKFIEALRSGKFTQGHNSLVKISINGDKKYCCLGVLCEISGMKEADQSYEYNNYHYVSRLPPGFRNKINMSDNTQYTLMTFNDFDEMNFNQIADWIEENI